jgi:hypothetical protein
MNLRIKKSSLKNSLNTLLRRTQRVEVTKLATSTVTVRNVYKNKQIIEVSVSGLNRCFFRI